MHILTALVENEVQNANRVNGIQLVVPVAVLGLLTNGESGVIHHAVGKIVLVHVLHLHYNVVTLVGSAIHIEDGAARIYHLVKMLRILVGDVRDIVPAFEKGVQERNQVLLVQFAAEDVLETEVGVRADISLSVHGVVVLLCKGTHYFECENGKTTKKVISPQNYARRNQASKKIPTFAVCFDAKSNDSGLLRSSQ